MSYEAFTNDYSSLRTPAYVAGETARLNAQRTRVQNAILGGNQLMGDLVTECCDNPAYGGQGYYEDPTAALSQSIASLVPGTPASTTAVAPLARPSAAVPWPFPGVQVNSPAAVGDPNAGGYPVTPWALTPVDILTGTFGFPLRRDGRPWPTPRLADKYRRERAANYPNYGPMAQAMRLVPPCPCFSSAAPVAIPVPAVAPAAAPAPGPINPASPCPYPGCSTGNVCLDLVTGCVLNSQVDQAQQTACALANYGVLGNKGWWIGRIMHDCATPPYLGTPLPNPPPADPSMMATINGVFPGPGLGGLGQVDLSGGGGLLAVLAMFGIVYWAIRK